MDDSPLADLLAPPVARRPRRRRGRRALLAVLAVVATAVLGAGGWLGTGWLRDADLRGALAVSVSVVEDVVGDAERAQGAPDLVLLAADAESALARLERAERRAAHVGDRGRPLGVELAAQRDVLRALLPLEAARRGPLQAWGRARVPLDEALAAERVARADLGRDRPVAARRLAVLDRLPPALDLVGGPLLERAATAEVDRVADVLRDARTTADLREAADLAVDQRAAVRVSSGVLPAGAELRRCAEVLAAVADLSGLSGEDVSSWPRVRPRLASGLGEPDVLLHLDGLVQVAESATARWRDAVAAARTAHQADADRLATHASGVRGLASPWRGLDAALEDLLTALVVRPVTAVDVDLLAADLTRRDALVSALGAVVAPALVEPEHQALVQASAADADGVRALAAGLAATAGDPPEPSRTAFGALASRREAAAAARSTAVQAWEAAVARAGALLSARPLPEPPLV